MNTAQLDKFAIESTEIAAYSRNSGTIHAIRHVLYRHPDKGYCLREFGGAAMATWTEPRSITEAEALDWIAIEAVHPVSGYGYTHDEARRLMAGENVRGTRDYCEAMGIK